MDIVIRGAHGYPITLKDMGDGTYAEVVSTPGGGGGASAANQLTEVARLEEIRDRLPSALSSGSLAVRDQAGAGSMRYLSDTTALTSVNFAYIQVITDSVFSTLTNGNSTTGSITGITIPAGTVLRGAFTAVQLTSGAVALYA